MVVYLCLMAIGAALCVMASRSDRESERAKRVTYPTVEQVRTAGIHAVLRWNRFLPSPHTDEERKVVDAVVARLKQLREAEPHNFVTASKQVGF